MACCFRRSISSGRKSFADRRGRYTARIRRAVRSTCTRGWPGDEFGGYLQASYGNWNTNNFEGAVNIPINENTAARVSFARRKSDGWIENHGPGHDNFVGDDHWGVRGLLAYQPTENLRLLLNVPRGAAKDRLGLCCQRAHGSRRCPVQEFQPS